MNLFVEYVNELVVRSLFKWSLIMVLAMSSIFLAMASGFAATEPPFTAKIFAQDSNKQKLLFTYKDSAEQKGDVRIDTHVYSSVDGQIAEVETTEFVKDGEREKVRAYHISQKQLGAEGTIERQGDKLNFSYTKDGSTKTNSEAATDEFVVGPSVMNYLSTRWVKIASGDKVKVRFGVPDRAETVGFEYFKDREETLDGQKVFVVKMKPSNFLIAALVKPLYFFITADGKTLLEVHGRTQVKLMADGTYHDLDAVTTFEYEKPQASLEKTESSGQSDGKAK